MPNPKPHKIKVLKADNTYADGEAYIFLTQCCKLAMLIAVCDFEISAFVTPPTNLYCPACGKSLSLFHMNSIDEAKEWIV